MKLNYRRTVYVGFAFLLICAFWQAYDNIIPKILTDKFGMNQFWSGVIMALDNILALFMLPLFGSISDRTETKYGRRTPYIVIGTVVAAVAFIALTVPDMMQLRGIAPVAAFDDDATLETLYSADLGELKTPDDAVYRVTDFSKEQWMSFKSDSSVFVKTPYETAIGDNLAKDGEGVEINPYINYVVPAREAYAWAVTSSDPTALIIFIAILLAALIAMATFRSPAVALMPDVTPKPLRSKGNAVINLMGSVGAVAVLVLGMLLGTGSLKNQLMDYTLYAAVVCGIMLISLVIFICKVKEPQFVSEMQKVSAEYGIDENDADDASGSRRLSRGEMVSLVLILASVVLWYMGYNAVTSKYSVYATKILDMDFNLTLIIAQAAAIAAYFPVGIISSKIGRKKAILAGVVILALSFAAAGMLDSNSSVIVMDILFALCGIGWATINVNSFPMAVELARGSDVGKYTGFYYTASMAAQTLTPILSGALMDMLGMKVLFPYAALFVAGSFVTMLLTRHGDSKPLPASSVLESMDVD